MLHLCKVLTHSSVLENSTFLKMVTIKTAWSHKWKINCFYKMDCQNQLIIIYAEPWSSHLLATETLYLCLTLFCQENSLKLDHVLLISSVDPENTESGLCIHLFSCQMNWTILIVPIVYYLQLLIREQSFQIGLYQFVILLATFPPYHMFLVSAMHLHIILD